ncbi:MAG TPA: methylmalonyl-CoA mutase family protein, partial [Bacteroidia bacterium]|nr:methylmalonyl-CoA mutase family protein [Bacteroidia bacterium]
IESLTDEVEAKAWDYIRKIDDMGGAVAAIEAGYIQNEIAESSYNYQNAIQVGEKVIVGVNKFQAEEPVFDDIFSVDDTIRKVQVQKLVQLRSERNNEQVGQALNNLETAAKDNTNLMPFIIQCVEHYATLGEISDALRKVFGEYR